MKNYLMALFLLKKEIIIIIFRMEDGGDWHIAEITGATGEKTEKIDYGII